MKTRLHFILLAFSFYFIFWGCQNEESLPIKIAAPFTSSEINRNFFNHLNWKKELSELEYKTLFMAMDSSVIGYEYQINLMIPALVHRVNSITKLDTLHHWENYRKYFEESYSMTEEEFDQYLFNELNIEELEVRIINPKFTHYSSISNV